MNNSRINGAYTLQECSRNMSTSDVAISKAEYTKETVKYSFDYDVWKSEVKTGCLAHSKHLLKPEDCAPPNQRRKTDQCLALMKPQLLKQPNDNGTYDCQEYGGPDDSQDNNGTDDCQDYNGTGVSPNIDGLDESQNNNGKYYSQDDDNTDDSKEDDGTDDSQDNNDTDDSQDDDGSDDGHKDVCCKQDEADLFYGTHETQVSEGGEADLHKHFLGCKKNPGHTKFVPVNDFNIHHMPEGHHDNNLVEFIKATADLTVRVAVKMTSPERPEFLPNTAVPYAFYNMRGSDVMRFGTGMVWVAYKCAEEDNNGFCQCHKCLHSDTPRKEWGVLRMYTATHVVFDDLEARLTTCRLFFDGQDSPLVTLDDWTVYVANIEEDRCLLKCVTCDLNLLDKLSKMYRLWRDLWMKVHNKYKSSRDKVKLTFIVSHPHGCSKQISVGQWINRCVVYEDEFNTNYTYTTCTCPGSSGAYVHPLGYDDWWYDGRHVHSGVNTKGNNFSGVGRDYH